MRKGVLRNFSKFTGKHLCQSLFVCNFIKKETLAQLFSCEFCQISKSTFFTEHLKATASDMISRVFNILLRRLKIAIFVKIFKTIFKKEYLVYIILYNITNAELGILFFCVCISCPP